MRRLPLHAAEHGLDSWADDLSARERVREVATTLTRPRSVQWAKEEAGISAWQTAKDELEMLVEFGQLHAIQGDDGNTKYAPNYQRRYFQQLTELVNEHTREELREEIGDIQAQIDEWKAEFGVGSREALESTLTDEGLDSAAVRERSAVLRRWERQEDNKRLVNYPALLRSV